MGLSGIGVTELLVILAILIMLFGTKKLRNLGGDLGGALKSFKNAMRESDGHERDEASAEHIEHREASADAVPDDKAKAKQT